VLGLGWVVRKMVHLTPLGWIDSLFGGVLGLLKAVILFWMLCLAFTIFPFGIDKLALHRSMVFQTYKKLPGIVKLPGLNKLRETLKIDPLPDLHSRILKKGPHGGQRERSSASTAKVI
jgi:hypothetical protein